MKNRRLTYLILILSVALIGCSSSENEETVPTESTEEEDKSTNHMSPQNYETSIDQEYLDDFDDIHTDLLNEIENNHYTIDNPFVEVNPYGTAPLTALVAFETNEPGYAEMIVAGKTEETTLSHTFEEMNSEHNLPILGLYPGTENNVTVNVYNNQDQLIASNELVIETEPLPENFWSLELAVDSKTEAMEAGLTFMVPSRGNLFAVDSLGEVRYLIEPWMANTFTQLENGNMILALRKEEDAPYKQLVEMNRLGKVEQAILLDIENYDKVNYFHHDMIDIPSGDWLVAIHDGSGDYIEDEMAVIDRTTGEILDNMNFRHLFPSEFYTDYTGVSSDDGDWFHQNAMWLTDDEEALLVSSRHQDATIKFSYPEGEFEWILAHHEKWPEELEAYLLDPIGEVKFPGAQHAMMELPDQDGNPATMDIVLFDNNRVITRGDESVEDQFSRGVQYRINEEERTVEEIWSYGEERGVDFFSRIVGDADYLPTTENILLTSGRIEVDDDNPESRIVEVKPDKDNEVVFEIVVSRFADEDGDRRQIYRSERLPLYIPFD